MSEDTKLAVDLPKRQLSIRFLIGLSNDTDNVAQIDLIEKSRRTRAQDYLLSVYQFGAFYDGVGVWQGRKENCMTFETIQPDLNDRRPKARHHAQRLSNMLAQDYIGLVFTNVELELHQ
jgi:hypothetical protein